MPREDWVKDPDQYGISVVVSLEAHEVVSVDSEALASDIATTFQALFPLVLIATSPDPLAEIQAYLVPDEPDGLALVPEYPLETMHEETFVPVDELKRWVASVERKRHLVLYGPPGTGKTFLAQRLARHLIGGGDGFVESVQFHPSYAYEDFVQGIRPKAGAEGELAYVLADGVFKRMCDRAASRRDRCVLVVDEINRANLSRVFGELMYLLEYRRDQIRLASGELFGIPENVRVIGTMNTADRSIALVDHALRRRFAFVRVGPNYDILRRFHDNTGYDVEKLIEVLRALNAEIGDEDYLIGVSFFLTKELSENMEDIWRMEIEPYLEEYFFDRRERLDKFRWSHIKDRVKP